MEKKTPDPKPKGAAKPPSLSQALTRSNTSQHGNTAVRQSKIRRIRAGY